ncbi:MAG: 2-oxoglutarate dehydrogenase complex dihydrolipoyllysine-residue succinyltransferase [Phycisphaerales bacterium]|jgi:2-oxoglutarate dehydrogenase E2 component (dihydrolipoamide succinyltransferase)|nr:2-oxoglutarate dehydrogenase complex dihydrolipoyllysine-residue succinyltransferase [Phycisphaerales bacterium]
MSTDIVIPSLGESISEVRLGRWLCRDGQWIDRDAPLVEIESDKVTQELPAPVSGIVQISEHEGADLLVGAVIGRIDSEAPRPEPAAGEPSPAAQVEVATENAASAEVPAPRATPMAKRIARDQGVELSTVHGSGPAGRVMKSDVRSAANARPTETTPAPEPLTPIDQIGQRGTRRERMSPLRRRIAERLVTAQHTAAMLTTFNEADMTEVIRLRKAHKDDFHDRFGVKLGFMSFFAKAVVSALQAFPAINAWIDGEEIEYHEYVDLSVAVGTDRGLVVPVIRNADRLGFAEIESEIARLAEAARAGQLGMDDLMGGTFTISNGGVYGSMMSTPILNPPQSAILGLHRISNRAVEDPEAPGTVTLRPMMYLAVSYDHRIIDGSEAVGFLVHIKECIESPERLLLGM